MRRCAACGYRSPTAPFFRREKSGAFDIRRTFCAGCEPYKPTVFERTLLVESVFCLTLGISLRAVEGPIGLGNIALTAGLLGPAFAVAVLVHELGHAVAGRAAGLRLHIITMGSGPLLLAVPMLGGWLQLRPYLTKADVQAYHPQPDPARWRQAIFVACGPGANLIAGAVGIATITMMGAVLDRVAPKLLVFLWMLVAFHFILGFGNLMPFSRNKALTSDGDKLVGLLRDRGFRERALFAAGWYGGWSMLYRRRFAEAAAHFAAAHAHFPTSLPLAALSIHAVGEAYGSHSVIALYHEMRTVIDLDTGDNFLAQATIAWHAIQTGDPPLFDLADRLSAKAIELRPHDYTAKGVRGAVLARQGHTEEGVALLKAAVRASHRFSEKAGFAGELAIVERSRGHLARAGDYAGLARHCQERSLTRMETG